MIGALVGIKRIPRDFIKKSVEFDCTNHVAQNQYGIQRHEFLSLKRVGFTKIGELIASMPQQGNQAQII